MSQPLNTTKEHEQFVIKLSAIKRLSIKYFELNQLIDFLTQNKGTTNLKLVTRVDSAPALLSSLVLDNTVVDAVLAQLRREQEVLEKELKELGVA